MYKIFLFLFFITISFSMDLTPYKSIKTNGEVIDLMLKNGKIFATTDSGNADIFDLKTKKLSKEIKFPKIKDFLGDLSSPRVFSVDEMGKDILLASQGTKGFSRVFLYYDNQLHKLFDEKDQMAIMKARYIDKSKIILALLSSEIILYDLKNKKIIYDKQISESKFSDFALNRDKTILAFSDESGSVKLVEVKSGNIIKRFSGQNLDNVYQIDYKNHIIAVASKDKKCGIYKDDGTLAYHKMSDFLVYSTGLSPDGKLCAYASDSKNNITIFNVETKSNLYKLTHNDNPISNIIFLNENSIITSDKNNIKFWKLK
jgi:hypothetical protein